MGIKSYIKRGLRYIVRGIPENYLTVTVKQTFPSQQLQGRNILITGGGRGLGFEIAKRCTNEGARVLITGRNEETLRKASQELGDRCLYLLFDVQDIKGIQVLFKSASQLFENQKIDSLVSNAGISLHEGDFRNVTEEDWDKQFTTNLKGNYFLVTEFIRYLESLKDMTGNIVVITSERSKRPDDIPYGLTKAATNSFIQAIASKVIEEGIRLNGIAPGVTCTDMTGYSKDKNMYVGWQPSKRIFLPEEVAEVANFLLSDVSNCISGEIITCDQGRYITHW